MKATWSKEDAAMATLKRTDSTTLALYLNTIFTQQFTENHLAYDGKVGELLAMGAYDGDRLIGGIIMRRRYDHLAITQLAIDRAYRGQKIGTQLIRAAERLARDRHVINITLSTRSYQAVGFYEKCGYQIYGTLPDLPFAGVTTTYFYKRLTH
ncbi:GNAT family N-acetyltransferase [Levilactobacillus suantsaiihabitans]|uniref:GNAT family N-acetyltransferase n=2 Tax=Levilactobacillus suantsaiihabitans TaxID=2487722 RepID=A0A4Z0J9E5_9LACO|nr:GNAT family N-acetyltransferase [Levilactobacillus suantsaiihabitans]